MKQLLLNWMIKDNKTLDDYYVGSNQHAFDSLSKSAKSIGDRCVYICGDSGVGLSHLLQGSCYISHQYGLMPFYISLKNHKNIDIAVFDSLEKMDLICIDDLDSICGNRDWEVAFLDCYNRIVDNKKHLVVASHLPPKKTVLLPDLVSRLNHMIVFQIQFLSDSEKIDVLMSVAKRKAFELPRQVAEYLLKHLPRDIGSLLAALDKIDTASLQNHRAITIQFARKVLNIK